MEQLKKSNKILGFNPLLEARCNPSTMEEKRKANIIIHALWTGICILVFFLHHPSMKIPGLTKFTVWFLDDGEKALSSIETFCNNACHFSQKPHTAYAEREMMYSKSGKKQKWASSRDIKQKPGSTMRNEVSDALVELPLHLIIDDVNCSNTKLKSNSNKVIMQKRSVVAENIFEILKLATKMPKHSPEDNKKKTKKPDGKSSTIGNARMVNHWEWLQENSSIISELNGCTVLHEKVHYDANKDLCKFWEGGNRVEAQINPAQVENHAKKGSHGKHTWLYSTFMNQLESIPNFSLVRHIYIINTYRDMQIPDANIHLPSYLDLLDNGSIVLTLVREPTYEEAINLARYTAVFAIRSILKIPTEMKFFFSSEYFLNFWIMGDSSSLDKIGYKTSRTSRGDDLDIKAGEDFASSKECNRDCNQVSEETVQPAICGCPDRLGGWSFIKDMYHPHLSTFFDKLSYCHHFIMESQVIPYADIRDLFAASSVSHPFIILDERSIPKFDTMLSKVAPESMFYEGTNWPSHTVNLVAYFSKVNTEKRNNILLGSYTSYSDSNSIFVFQPLEAESYKHGEVIDKDSAYQYERYFQLDLRYAATAWLSHFRAMLSLPPSPDAYYDFYSHYKNLGIDDYSDEALGGDFRGIHSIDCHMADRNATIPPPFFQENESSEKENNGTKFIEKSAQATVINLNYNFLNRNFTYSCEFIKNLFEDVSYEEGKAGAPDSIFSLPTMFSDNRERRTSDSWATLKELRADVLRQKKGKSSIKPCYKAGLEEHSYQEDIKLEDEDAKEYIEMSETFFIGSLRSIRSAKDVITYSKLGLPLLCIKRRDKRKEESQFLYSWEVDSLSRRLFGEYINNTVQNLKKVKKLSFYFSGVSLKPHIGLAFKHILSNMERGTQLLMESYRGLPIQEPTTLEIHDIQNKNKSYMAALECFRVAFQDSRELLNDESLLPSRDVTRAFWFAVDLPVLLPISLLLVSTFIRRSRARERSLKKDFLEGKPFSKTI